MSESQPSSMDRISSTRLRGFEQGFGSNLQERYLIVVDSHRAATGEAAFTRYMQLTDRPRGVFCASDDLALGFFYEALRAGLKPGRDYHLIGFDGQTRGQHLPGGPLSTVRVPVIELGTVAADMLLSRFDQPELPIRRVLLGCDFISGCTAVVPIHPHSHQEISHGS